MGCFRSEGSRSDARQPSRSERGASAKREKPQRTRAASSGGHKPSEATKPPEGRMPGRLRANGIPGCLSSSPARMRGKADFRQKIQESCAGSCRAEGDFPSSHGASLEALSLSKRTFKAAALASASASSNGEVTRRFAFTPASKAGLCPWPLVTGTACVAAFQGNYFQSLGFPSRESAFPRIRAGEEERHPGMPFARNSPRSRASASSVASLGF